VSEAALAFWEAVEGSRAAPYKEHF
jgi:hypothetical protein